MIVVQDVRLDPRSRKVWRGEDEVRPGEVVTRSELMAEVWQTHFFTSSKTIDVHLGWLRRKLGDDPRNPELITTLRGRGIRFENPEELRLSVGE